MGIDWVFWTPRLVWFAFGSGVGFIAGLAMAIAMDNAPELPWHD